MTHLCYSLEETAERLDMSETVLVRLSQYFKVPKSAYEELGYLSFKGDLAFSDFDIAFFRQVKEHLLAGESLEQVKSRIRQPGNSASEGAAMGEGAEPTPASFKDLTQTMAEGEVEIPEQKLIRPVRQPQPSPAEAPSENPAIIEKAFPEGSGAAEPLARPADFEEPVAISDVVWDKAAPPEGPLSGGEGAVPEAGPSAPSSHAISPVSAGKKAWGQTPPQELSEIETPDLARKAAEKNFSRYKGKHRSRPIKVFENMIRQVGSVPGAEKSFGSLPFVKPLKPKVDRPDVKKSVRLDPIGLSQTRDIEFERQQAQSKDVAQMLDERFPWKPHLKQASRQPRKLDERVQQAARQIRAQATGIKD